MNETKSKEQFKQKSRNFGQWQYLSKPLLYQSFQRIIESKFLYNSNLQHGLEFEYDEEASFVRGARLL